MTETPDQEPEAEPPVGAVADELEAAVAAFDARERALTVEARPPIEPVSLGEVDRRVWFGAALGLVLIGMLLGGAPWHTGFWIALAAVLLVMCPIVGTAVFLWRRNR